MSCVRVFKPVLTIYALLLWSTATLYADEYWLWGSWCTPDGQFVMVVDSFSVGLGDTVICHSSDSAAQEAVYFATLSCQDMRTIQEGTGTIMDFSVERTDQSALVATLGADAPIHLILCAAAAQ